MIRACMLAGAYFVVMHREADVRDGKYFMASAALPYQSGRITPALRTRESQA